MKLRVWMVFFISLLYYVASSYAGSAGHLYFVLKYPKPIHQEIHYKVYLADKHCLYSPTYAIGDKITEFSVPANAQERLINLFHYEQKASSTGGDTCASDNRYVELKLEANFPSYSTTVKLSLKSGNALYPNSAYVGVW